MTGQDRGQHDLEYYDQKPKMGGKDLGAKRVTMQPMLEKEIMSPESVEKESEETTHLSIVDGSGNAVAITTTLNGGYGACTVVGGAGFLLNNEMDDFAADVQGSNAYGLSGSQANRIAAEHLTTVQGLWDSWEDDALVADPATGEASSVPTSTATPSSSPVLWPPRTTSTISSAMRPATTPRTHSASPRAICSTSPRRAIENGLTISRITGTDQKPRGETR